MAKWDDCTAIEDYGMVNEILGEILDKFAEASESHAAAIAVVSENHAAAIAGANVTHAATIAVTNVTHAAAMDAAILRHSDLSRCHGEIVFVYAKELIGANSVRMMRMLAWMRRRVLRLQRLPRFPMMARKSFPLLQLLLLLLRSGWKRFRPKRRPRIIASDSNDCFGLD